jgi:hypothetical protein
MFRAPSEVCQKIFSQRKNTAMAKMCPKLGKNYGTVIDRKKKS